MALQNCLYLVLLLLSQQLGSAAQGDVGDPEPLTHYDISNQDNSVHNEAADDKFCLSGNDVVTSKNLAERFHDGAVLSKEDFRRLLTDIQTGLQDYGADDFAKDCAKSTSALVQVNGVAKNCSEMLTECPRIEEIYSRHSDKGGGGLLYSHLAAALQEAAFSLTNPKCHVSHAHHKGYKPTTAQAWGYGIGFVTSVCIISNIGGLLTPFMNKTFFQRLLQFLVAMGAGTLAATGLLVLLPEAFDIVSMEELGDDYIWKAATALFSIYVFFVSERFLKFLLKSREDKQIMRNQSLHIDKPIDNDEEKDAMTSSLENGQSDHGHSHFVTPPEDGGRRGKSGPVATVAWMVMIGDVIHNFVDGMAIGAAFTENVYLGVSIGIAVLCEELPHELGDVAILLHSGMSMKRALLVNFLSACVCYLGLVLGILLGENTEATRWILAIAAGLFLYVPLVDMLPDMSQYLDMKVREGNQTEGKAISREAWLVLICQSLGLLIGICIILVVVNFSGDIVIDN